MWNLGTPIFATAGVHPYDEVTWERRDVVQTNSKTGEIVFEQRCVEFPDFWTENASTIVTTKYFRGALGTAAREDSLKTLIDRVIDKYRTAAETHGYVAGLEEGEAFANELKWMLVHQYFSFNSPVWLNVGTPSPQQVSACFILALDPSNEGVFRWYRDEAMILKWGSGSGLNISSFPSKKEVDRSLDSPQCGPVDLMRAADSLAGAIKCGGVVRGSAKMIVLDVDHPDIEDFVDIKIREEEKIRALRDADFDMDLGGKDLVSVQYQNANNTVRVTDAFMHAVEEASPFGLRSRKSGEVIEHVDARRLFKKIAYAAWACGDPGIQYDDAINAWHTNPETGRINASNPCSEFMSLDNSSCNLASLNLLKFLDEHCSFDVDRFVKAVELVVTAMDVSICIADFPSEPIAKTTRDFRQLGLGFANLGALLMATGRGYDSESGRSMAAAITSLMTGAAYRRSSELAYEVGTYAGYALNRLAHLRVMSQHQAANDRVLVVRPEDQHIHDAATAEWTQVAELGRRNGFRNAQVSALAPTGTIGFMMDCDTTGVEPDFSLMKLRKLAGGDSLHIANSTIQRALRVLGYSDENEKAISAYIEEYGHVVGAPRMRQEHYEVFDTATGPRAIAPMGHVRMMAAVQPFISGAISKTVNLPESATVEEVEHVYLHGWKLGLKSLTVYRDNCKVGQPLLTRKVQGLGRLGDR